MVTQVKIYSPHEARTDQSDDPGVAWSADVLSRLVDMGWEFVKALARLGAVLLRSLLAARAGQ